MFARSSPFISVLLREYHDTLLGGHAGELKTYLCLAAEWYWEDMRRQVTNYVRECQICQKTKASNQSPAGLLQNLPIASQVWEHITMDFIEGLPTSEGVMLTKFGHFVALKHSYTAFKVVAKFVKEVVQLHGFPTSIVSGRDKVFMSIFWWEMFRLQHTHLLRSTTFHPQTDGQIEIVNKMVKHTYDALPMNIQRNGQSGYIGLNLVTTHPLSFPLKCLHFKLCTGEYLHT